jgi:hypothetical protein
MLLDAANILFASLLLSRSASAELEARGRYHGFHGFPKYRYEPNTIPYCIWWLDNQGDWTCDRIKHELGLPLKDFHDWVGLSPSSL